LNSVFFERSRFTLVLDGGTLEHVFDYPAALRQCLELVALSGHFITIAPAQNQMGHGFYQISPELFFRVLSGENGFTLRKMVLFDTSRIDAPFFEVRDPALRRRLAYSWNSGAPTLRNRQHFRRISRQEIFRERSGNQTTDGHR